MGLTQYTLQYHSGVSFIFLALDSSGALFSLLSLVFKPTFDGLAAANYIGILILEFAVFTLAIVLNPRAKKRRRSREQVDLEEQQEQEEKTRRGKDLDTPIETQATNSGSGST